MRVHWFIGIPWWVALRFWVIGLVVMLAAAVVAVGVLLLVALASSASWLAGATISRRWPETAGALQNASRLLWRAVERVAMWVDAFGIGRRPRDA